MLSVFNIVNVENKLKMLKSMLKQRVFEGKISTEMYVSNVFNRFFNISYNYTVSFWNFTSD